ncbi:MAG: hypothetical protein JSW26_22570 [Desulfobacterales bacterium]|nr:MAG: hypothetical protein JSW26_22570 [Desulfobacterales bacterium]
MKENVKNKLVPFSLGVLQIFIGITAVMGGFGLVSDPTGNKMDVPLGLLKNSPFTSYLIPGLILLIFNGFGNVLAGTATFVRHRHAANLAIFFGVFLTLYMTIEVWIIGLQNFSQPLYIFLGAAELTLGIKLYKSAKKDRQTRNLKGLSASIDTYRQAIH